MVSDLSEVGEIPTNLAIATLELASRGWLPSRVHLAGRVRSRPRSNCCNGLRACAR